MGGGGKPYQCWDCHMVTLLPTSTVGGKRVVQGDQPQGDLWQVKRNAGQAL